MNSAPMGLPETTNQLSGAGGLDRIVFKCLIVALVASVSITTRPLLILGRRYYHDSLVYADLPIVLLICGAVVLARAMTTVRSVKTRTFRVFFPLIALTIWWAVSGMLYAKSTDFFLASILQYSTGVLLILFAPWMLAQHKLIDFSLNTILFFSILVSLIGLVQSVLDPSLIFQTITATLGENRTHIGLYMVTAMAVALHRLHSNAHKWAMLAAFLAFVMVLFSGSRSAQLGTFLLLGIHLLRRISLANLMKWSIVSAITFGALWHIMQERQKTANAQQRQELGTARAGEFKINKKISIDNSAGMRLFMWAASWEVISSSQKRFFQGIGFTNFRFEHGRLLKIPFYSNAAHNALLHIWTETGLLGMLLYLWMLVALIRYAARNKKSDSKLVLLTGLSSAMLVTGLTQETLFPNEAFCNFNVLFEFTCLLFILHHQTRAPEIPRVADADHSRLGPATAMPG